MAWFRPHRLTWLAFLVLLAAVLGAAVTADRVVDENEAQLLADRADEVASLLGSLGTAYEARMASVGATAHATGGNTDRFAASVSAIDPGAPAAAKGGWALLRRTGDGSYVTAAAVGAPLPADGLPPTWSPGLDRAAGGTFTVLGFTGEGLERRFAMAAGLPGVPGELVVYFEASLIGAAAESAGDSDEDVIEGLAVVVYIGTEPDPTQRLLAFGEPEGEPVEQTVDISGVPVLLEVSPTEPLAGSLARWLPVAIGVAGAVLSLALAALVEVTLRRRDDALATVADLELKNAQLDRALEEQRIAEAARTALEVELRQSQRLDAIGHLAGGVAHDFNNVLAAILSYADLARDSTVDERVVADLDAIQGAARKGADLTRQLLQFSRREVGEAVDVDLNERVRDVAGMLGRTLGDGVQLVVATTSEPTVVHADAVELDQVLLNLVVNARDAVGPGGTIRVDTSRRDVAEPSAQLPGVPPGAYVQLTVHDDGAGMSDDVVEHAFEPFFTTKGRGEGTGLGLATVYGIVQRHDGHISLRSSPGVGTTIEVLLPVTASHRPTEAPGSAAQPVGTS